MWRTKINECLNINQAHWRKPNCLELQCRLLVYNGVGYMQDEEGGSQHPGHCNLTRLNICGTF